MNMQDLASFAARPGRIHRRHHHCHAADCGDIELETLATAQPRSAYYLHFGQFVVPGADTVDGLRAEMVVAPEFTDPEFCGSCNGANVSTAPPRNELTDEHVPNLRSEYGAGAGPVGADGRVRHTRRV